MRRLVNAYGRHLGGLMMGDSFDTLVAVLEIAAWSIGLFVVVVGALWWLASATADTQGSCKVEHRVGKSYVCDEYYPLPVQGATAP